MRPLRRPRDPAPSRLAFRLKRLWRSRGVRRAFTVWLPATAVAGLLVWASAQPAIRSAIETEIASLRAELSERPEFAVRSVDVRGASPEIEREVRLVLARYLGTSSLNADAAAIREDVARIGWIASARVRLAAPETLIVTVTEREAVVIWRADGALTMLDSGGIAIAPLDRRADRPDLPVIAGKGADQAVPEALNVIGAAGPLTPKLRGLVRIGERRWDAILHEGPKIMLPADGAASAMGFAAALEAAETVTALDVEALDLRLKSRRTLRLTPDAAATMDAKREQKTPGEEA